MTTWLPALPKSVNFFPDERLELLDVEALKQLIYDYIAIVSKSLLGAPNTPTTGWIFQGFTMSPTGGLNVQIDIGLRVAIDVDGRFIVEEGTAPTALALTDNASNYIYTYLLDVSSDQDGRRAWDRASSVEVAVSDYTRKTPTLGFLKTVAPSTTTVINGTTIPLIPLYQFDTLAGAITSTIDLRSLFGNVDGSHSFVVTDFYTHGVYDIHTAYSALATRIKEILYTGAGNWWENTTIRALEAVDNEILAARVPPPSGLSAKASLFAAIEASRRSNLTVGTGTPDGDYTAAAGLTAALNRADGDGGGEIFVKHGTYTGLGSVTVGLDGMTISGVKGWGSNGTVIIPTAGTTFSITGRTGITFRNLKFDMTGAPGSWKFAIIGAGYITFENCTFTRISGSTSVMFDIQGSSNVSFVDCVFSQLGDTFPMVSFNTSQSEYVSFRNCKVYTFGQWISSGVGVSPKGIDITNCQIVLYSPPSGDLAIGMISINPDTTDCMINILDNRIESQEGPNHFLLPIDVSAASATVGSDSLVNICRNQFYALGGVSAVGIYANSPYGRALISENEFNVNTSNFIAIAWRGLGSSPGHFLGTISRNRINLNGNSGSKGIVVVGVLGAPATIGGMIISENQIHQAGDHAVHLIYSTQNVSIHNNYFYSPAKSAVACSSTTTYDNLSIENNTVYGGGTATAVTINTTNYASAIFVSALALQNVRIFGNMIQNFATSYTTGAHGPILTFGPCYNVSICQNQLYQNGNTGALAANDKRCSGQIAVLFHDTQGRSLQINNNHINFNGWGAGVFIYIGNNGAGHGYGCQMVDISQNTIYQSLTGTGDDVATGIKLGDAIDPLGAGNSDQKIDNLLVCNNNLTVLATDDLIPNYATGAFDGNLAAAASLVFGSSASTVQYLTFRGNLIRTNKSYQIHMGTTANGFQRYIANENISNTAAITAGALPATVGNQKIISDYVES